MDIGSYKGLMISFNENSKMFMVQDDGNSYETYQEAEKRIDTLSKASFKKIPIIIMDNGASYVGEMTSYNTEIHEAWIRTDRIIGHGVNKYSAKRPGRSKVTYYGNSRGLYKNTAHNLSVASDIAIKYTLIRNLEEEIRGLYNSFELELTKVYLSAGGE